MLPKPGSFDAPADSSIAAGQLIFKERVAVKNKLLFIHMRLWKGPPFWQAEKMLHPLYENAESKSQPTLRAQIKGNNSEWTRVRIILTYKTLHKHCNQN